MSSSSSLAVWCTYAMLTLNFLIILPMPFVFLFGYDPPAFLVDPDDKGALGIFNEYSWNPLIKVTLGFTVPCLSMCWFGLTSIPRSWRLFPVAIAALSVVYVNNVMEDDFLTKVTGSGIPRSGMIVHIIQANAFLSVLLAPEPENISYYRPKWASMIWSLLVLVNNFVIWKNYYFISSGEACEVCNYQELEWLLNIQDHSMASFTYLWCNTCLMLATIGLSWYAPLKYKILPFTLLAGVTIWISITFQTQLAPNSTGLPIDPIIMAVVYLLQLLIPSPANLSLSKEHTE